MMKSKAFLASKTIWGLIVAALPTLAPLIGLNLTADDASMLGSHVDAVLQAVGFALALYGRVKADKPLSVLGG